MNIAAKPLNAEEFAPYGDVLAPPAEFGRVYFDRGLRSTRLGAWPSLSVAHAKFLRKLPLEATVMDLCMQPGRVADQRINSSSVTVPARSVRQVHRCVGARASAIPSIVRRVAKRVGEKVERRAGEGED